MECTAAESCIVEGTSYNNTWRIHECMWLLDSGVTLEEENSYLSESNIETAPDISTAS